MLKAAKACFSALCTRTSFSTCRQLSSCPQNIPLRLYFDPCYTLKLPEGHRFPMERYCAVRETARRTLPESLVTFLEPPLATVEEICSAHDPEYVDAFVNQTLDQKKVREIGFPMSDDLVHRTLKITGATLQASRDVLSGHVSVAANLAGGTHHAHADKGSGFCIFNDLAVAARLALEGKLGRPVRRVLVIDLDVHQGDGTANMLRGIPGAFTFSLHSRKNFPFRKQASDVDVECEDEITDKDYIDLVHHWVSRLMKDLGPNDLVLYQAGVDPLAADRLGRLSLTRSALQQRNRMVLQACVQHEVPIVCTMGGGYAQPIQESADAHVDVFVAALEAHQAFQAKCQRS